MMLLQEKQKGMTFLGYAIVLGLIGFFAVMAMKLTPLYLEYQSVVKIMNDVAEQFPPNAPPNAIRIAIGKGLGINNIKAINPKDFQLVREKNTTLLTIKYEARTSFIGNLWFLLLFDHSVPLRGA